MSSSLFKYYKKKKIIQFCILFAIINDFFFYGVICDFCQFFFFFWLIELFYIRESVKSLRKQFSKLNCTKCHTFSSRVMIIIVQVNGNLSAERKHLTNFNFINKGA